MENPEIKINRNETEKLSQKTENVRYLPIQISKLNTLKNTEFSFSAIRKKFDKHRIIFSFFFVVSANFPNKINFNRK